MRNRVQIQPTLVVRRVSNHSRPCIVYPCCSLRPVSSHRFIPAAFWGPDPAARASARRIDAYHVSATIPPYASINGSIPVAVQSIATIALTHRMER